MILTASGTSANTFDDLFRRAAIRDPQRPALCDPPNRAAIAGGEQRRLTFLDIDNAVTAIAARLRKLGLGTDAVIAYQLANTVESVLLPLGIARAGMIAAPLPMLWRQREIAAALPRLGAAMLIAARRIDDTDHLSIAMQAAAEYFPLRHVGAFGDDIPDGVIPLDPVFTESAALPAVSRPGAAADHVALVTLDAGPEGLFAVARSHAQLLAGNSDALDGALLTAIPLSSHAGFALALVPWLRAGSQLVLHHPFDDEIFAAQCREHRCANVVLPGPAVAPLTQAGLLDREHGLQHVVALWRSPELWRKAQRAQSPFKLGDRIALGDLALTDAARDANGRPLPLDFTSQRDLVFLRGENGTLAVQGASVPHAAFPPGAERGIFPFLKTDDAGFTDTGMTVQNAQPGERLDALTPPSLVQNGGYRWRLADLEAPLYDADPHSRIAALPHSLLGQRLAGSAQEPGAIAALASALNPLIGEAFTRKRAA